MIQKRIHRSHKHSERRVFQSMRGATLVEMFCLMALAICILIGVFIVTAIIKSWYGWLLGVVLGSLAFFVIGLVWNVLREFWSGSGLPKCRSGCCRGPGFSLRDEGDYDTQKSGEEYYDVCKCGDRYQRRGRRFVLINDDGTETPYMIWRRFRGWAPDKGEAK